MACKLVIQSNDGVDLNKFKIKSPEFAPLVGDCIRIQLEGADTNYKVLCRTFCYDDSGDVKLFVRCERVAATIVRETDD